MVEVKLLMDRRRQSLGIAMLAIIQILQGAQIAMAQTSVTVSKDGVTSAAASGLPQDEPSSLARYVDPQGGVTADEAVAYGLARNGELLAARAELTAARARVQQAGLRANPRVDVSGTRQVIGPDNNIMVGGMLPLELGGRRAARVAVAERELEMREQMLSDRERVLAAEVRAKFGAALAEVSKLGFTEELLTASRRGYELVVARVSEGRTAPLEQNMVLVEVNRVRSMREGNEGKVEVALLELRNLIGMKPDEPLRLRGDFSAIEPLPSLAEATERALSQRPDLQATRTSERLAEAQVEEARAAGRADASLTAGYQRMNSSFPVMGINKAGQLRPVQDVFHFLTFGVSIDLPVRNRNQGAIEAAAAQAEAATRRREFAELTVRREVAAAYAQYEHATRALEIFRAGVRREANANLNVVRQTYELGAKTLLDYIAEQRRFIDIENGYIDALLESYLARVEIARVTTSPDLVKR